MQEKEVTDLKAAHEMEKQSIEAAITHELEEAKANGYEVAKEATKRERTLRRELLEAQARLQEVHNLIRSLHRNLKGEC